MNAIDERKFPRPNARLVTLVCPVLDEEQSVAPFAERLARIFKQRPDLRFELLFINDGSRDDTLLAIENLIAEHDWISCIDLSRNFGKEAALTAGLDHAKGDAVIPIDVDLQDPPELILEMIEHWENGFEVVLAKRVDRSADDPLKRLSAHGFYWVMRRLMSPPLPENVGDFRLMDRSVIEALRKLGERRRFMKGMFAWVGFKTHTIEFVRPPRQHGESKFRSWRLWNFALEGVTSFSTAPLRIWTYLGLAIATIAFLYGALIIMNTLIWGADVPGYASLAVITLFMTGVNLIGLGILGEYVGRIYDEVKQRPNYLVRKVVSKRDSPRTVVPLHEPARRR